SEWSICDRGQPMKRAIFVIVVALAAVVAAAPRKVLVLAIEGNAPAAQRAKLGALVVKLARSVDGKVQTGNTTFSETASAVGCDPSAPACVDSVLSTMAVDEVVWGEATIASGQTKIVIHRATKGAPPREITATIGEKDPADRAEAGIKPVFLPPVATPPP